MSRGVFFVALGASGLGQDAAATDWAQFRGPAGQGISSNRGLPVTWSADRNIVWKVSLPGPGGSSPVVFQDSMLLTSYSGYAVPGATGGDLDALTRQVICLQRNSGAIVWKKDLPAVQPEQAKVRDHGYASNTPLADADRLYVFFGASGVFAFSHDKEPSSGAPTLVPRCMNGAPRRRPCCIGTWSSSMPPWKATRWWL